ncbi:MOSC domain-containing protein [Streptomyces sp. HU2014]|uniref:MOSC domain-containing protein n=1 Tax=Streptomyces sp. HU2014 TaxID=2939414 RepID=UPI0020107A4A|nr:MOSC domain-containing protein [Streptomyces sp. HU2014]UQI43139.1 MOSC domain-containing protein [Streptomyces sp. HU2014]
MPSPSVSSPSPSPSPAPSLLSVNVGRDTTDELTGFTPGLRTGIDKRPVAGPVAVAAPGPRGVGGSGLAGDTITHLHLHGGDDQAVYAYAREDLDRWQRELGRALPDGTFGENFTTQGIDVSGALVGERWRVGPELVLEVTSPRIPCRMFADWLGEQGWMKRFTQAAVPGAYLRVITPGEVRAGDPVTVVHRPAHSVTVSFLFRASTTERTLLPDVLAAGDALPEATREKALAYRASA